MERANHIAEWVRLTEEKNKGATCADTPRGRGQPQGGINAAVRDLGVDRTEAQRAVKVSSLSDEAKQAISDAGIGHQQVDQPKMGDMNSIDTWSFEGLAVRTVLLVNETKTRYDARVSRPDLPSVPWWVLADVCRVLEIGNRSMAASRLDDDERGVSALLIPPPAGSQGSLDYAYAA